MWVDDYHMYVNVCFFCGFSNYEGTNENRPKISLDEVLSLEILNVNHTL